MQIELTNIQRELGITFIYVTHDQDEALTMSDRIAVFNDGRIEQIATSGRGLRASGQRSSSRASWALRTSSSATSHRFTIRPEKIHIGPEAEPARDGFTNELGRISEVVYLGPVTRYIVELDAGGQLVAVRQNLETSSQEPLNRGVTGSGYSGARDTRLT